MDITLNTTLGFNYTIKQQKIRVITETWAECNLFCPICGNNTINHQKANKPVLDFLCPNCNAEYELKSRHCGINRLKPAKIVPDGAYETMISRITSNNNPHFFFLFYNKEIIQDVFLVPNFLFSYSQIIKRPPLKATAQRAGWVGCNIDLSSIPEKGKIYIIHNRCPQDKEIILEQMRDITKFRITSIERRGWLFDVLKCIEEIPNSIFSLQDTYTFVSYLYKLHPDNHNIEAKIRQQLQFLRDKGIIEFIGNGLYHKLF